MKSPTRLPVPDQLPPTGMELADFEGLMSDYVSGRLAAGAMARFEDALLANPGWAHWVEAEQLLRAGVRHLAQQEPELFDAPDLSASP